MDLSWRSKLGQLWRNRLMANKDIFCAIPWHASHLYWDGSYGACCEERNKPPGEIKNISEVSLAEWYNSSEMRAFRLRVLGDTKLPECESCYKYELQGHESKRVRENFKVGIFTKQAFEKSFNQSPWFQKFTESAAEGSTDCLPIDLHIDFGNQCNLACKMCNPSASSRIAQQYKSWQIAFDKKLNWSESESAYQQLLANIKSIKKLNRIHIMGGEPTINKKFYKFLDWLINNNFENVSLSFVSNGTKYNDRLIEKLSKFRSVDIEISLESIHDNNHYIRQGSDTSQTLTNILKILDKRSPSLNLVLRSVPQLLNVNNYHEYIRFAYKNKISIQSIPLISPRYLAIGVLPKKIRESFVQNYQQVKQELLQNVENTHTLATGRDTSRLEQQLAKECDTIINLLNQPETNNILELQQELIAWLLKWDKKYNLNALNFYPEYNQFLCDSGYRL
jgi:MoaA/NifB/PqqE/SkfB family radical SAM enzyme